MQEGCSFEYLSRRWVVERQQFYEWDNDYISREYTVSDGQDHLVIHVINGDELLLYALHTLNVPVPDVLRYAADPPDRLKMGDVMLNLYFSFLGYSTWKNEWVTVQFVLYADDALERTAIVKKWHNGETELYAGIRIYEDDIVEATPSE